MDRINDLIHFYTLLDGLERKLGGRRTLAECDGRMSWPARGVYFFFEEGEERTDSGSDARVVRVGTHALTAKSRTTLWNRLSQHKGVKKTGGGNHRGSIFRQIVGSAMKRRQGQNEPRSWGIGSDIGQAARKLGVDGKTLRLQEAQLEVAVSEQIGAMPFLWLSIDDPPGCMSLRRLIEQNSIALLSDYDRDPVDPPSKGWLGHHSDRHRVLRSGLWNNNHVEDRHDPRFLRILENLVEKSGTCPTARGA